MDTFFEALLGTETPQIPDEYDWFSNLLGDWNLDYYDGDAENPRHVEGEWIFRRVLNGTGIEDIFICPSRKTITTDPQPDGEYGVAIRIFNQTEKCYDMVYACERYMCRLKFVLEGEKLIGTVVDTPSNKWVFSEIQENSFRWQNITVDENNEWKVNSTICAKRK